MTSADEIWRALALGAVPFVGLLVGPIAGSFSRMPHQRIAMTMSVGAGLLLAGVSLKVAADAIRIAGPVAAALSLLLGAAVFSASNALLARFGAAHRKRCGDVFNSRPSRSSLAAESPSRSATRSTRCRRRWCWESLCGIRSSLSRWDRVLSGQFSRGLSSTAGMRAGGRSYRYVFLLWSAIAIGGAVAIAAGYVGFGSLNEVRIAPVFGSGALSVSPRVGHIHVTVDVAPWHWADASGTPLILRGLPPGRHTVLIELVDANHQTVDKDTVTFVVPNKATAVPSVPRR